MLAVVAAVVVIVMHNQLRLSTFDLKQTAGFAPRVESVLPDFVTGFCIFELSFFGFFFFL